MQPQTPDPKINMSANNASQHVDDQQHQSSIERHDPGKGLNIAGLVLVLLVPYVGVFLSSIGTFLSKKAGFNANLGIIGIVLNSVFIIIYTIGAFLLPIIIAGIIIAPLKGDTIEEKFNNVTNDFTEMASQKGVDNVINTVNAYQIANKQYPSKVSDLSSSSVPAIYSEKIAGMRFGAKQLTEKPRYEPTVIFFSCGQDGVKVGRWDYKNNKYAEVTAPETLPDSASCSILTD